MNTENLIDQINTLIDQAPVDIVENAFSRVIDNAFDLVKNRIAERMLDDSDTQMKEEAKEILTNLIQELAPARVEVKNKNFTTGQLEAAMFNITREISRVDEYTNNQDVINYAEHLAREIMYATKKTTPDTCEH